MSRAPRRGQAKPQAQPLPGPKPAPAEPHLFDRPDALSWSEFHTAIDQFLDGEHLFRGVTNAKHRLIPSVGRTGETWTYCPLVERELLAEFKREAVPYLRRNIADDDDWAWLALAQHHGVPTRLLDWSESPHVASSSPCGAAAKTKRKMLACT